MAREILSRQELEAWLTEALREFKDCEQCSITGVKRLDELDESGCNWSESVELHASATPVQITGPAVAKVVARARRKFNIR